LLTAPSNLGWPFVNGDIEPYTVRDYETDYKNAGMAVGTKFDITKLQNLSKFNTGIKDLPTPTVHPLVYYSAKGLQVGLSKAMGSGSETVIAGPTYDFNPANASTVKMPPYFHRKVIFGDYSRHYLWLASVDANGALTKLERIKNSIGMTDIHMGPDGSIYYLDYDNGGVSSITYTGSQKDYTACSFIKPGCTDPKSASYDATANMMTAGACSGSAINAKTGRSAARMLRGQAFGLRRITLPAGTTGAEAYDVHGARVATVKGKAGQAVELPARNADGVLLIRYLAD
jgi:hypothetical protein